MLHHTYRSPDTSVKTVSTTRTDGRSKYGYSRTAVRPPHAEAPSTRILLLNGLFEGRFAFQPLVERMAELAMRRGHGLDVVSYDDPRVGSAAYAQAYRTQRAYDMAHLMSERLGAPITLAGHSRGNWSGVEITPELRKDNRVRGLVSIGGIGYTPKSKDAWRARNILRLTGSEVSGPESRRLCRTAAPTLGRIVCEGAVHTLSNWNKSVGEVEEILSVDLIEPTMRESHELPVHVVALLNDKFCPGGLTRINLEAPRNDGLTFAGAIHDLPTNHAGPLMDPQFTPDLYNIMCVKQESTV